MVQIDADGQHDPAQVAVLQEELRRSGADLVIGARFAGVGDYVQTGARRWAMRIIAAVLSAIVGTRLSDATSGFTLLGPRAVALFAEQYPAEYLGDTVEALVIGHRHGLGITQVGVRMRPRLSGVPSQGPVKALVVLVRAIMAVRGADPAPPRLRGGGGPRMRAYLFPLVFGILTVAVMLWLPHSRYARDTYTATWMLIGSGVLLFAVFPGLLFWLAVLGVVTPANIAFFVGALALLLICVQLCVELSRHEERIRRLAEEIALLRAAPDGRDPTGADDRPGTDRTSRGRPRKPPSVSHRTPILGRVGRCSVQAWLLQ